MSEHLRRLVDAAAAAWPELRAERSELERIFSAHEWGRNDDDVVAADLALAWACLQGLERATRGLLERFDPLIVRELGRTGLSGAELDDVRQAFAATLLVGANGREPKLRQYRGESELGPWLRVCVLRFALNSVRGRREQVGLCDEPWVAALAAANPELDYLVRRYGAELSDAVAQAVIARSDEDLRLLRYHYLEGMDFAAIAAILRVHRTTVSRRVTQITEQLRRDIRQLLQERLSIGTDTLDSLFTALVSQLPLSIRRLLGTEPT